MKPFKTKSIFALLFLMTGFLASFAQTGGTGSSYSSNTLKMPFAYGTSFVANTQLAPGNVLRQVRLEPVNPAGLIAVYAPQAGAASHHVPSSTGGTITWCDSVSPGTPGCPEAALILDLGLEVLIMHGINDSTLPTSILAPGGTNLVEGQFIGFLSSHNILHMEIYVPTPGTPIFDANGMIQRNWQTTTQGREIFQYDANNREPVFCVGTSSRTLNHGEVLYNFGCFARKMDELEKNNESLTVFPQPANRTLSFELESNESGTTLLELLDAQGRIIASYEGEGKKITIETADMESGLYFYRHTSTAGRKTGKVLISH